MFVLEVKKNNIQVLQRETITTGSYNANVVKFLFSPEWEGLSKTAVFRSSGEPVSIFLSEHAREVACEIPWEVIDYDEVGNKLYIGVYGSKENAIVIPTMWVNAGKIMEGVDLGEDAKNPTPGIYDQMVSAADEAIRTAEEAKEIAESVRQDADNGVFNGKDGEDGHTPVLGVDYMTDEDIDKIADKIIEKLPGFSELPEYDGEIDIVPSFEEQVLQTKGKSLNEDITVHPIKVTGVANESGGITVKI